MTAHDLVSGGVARAWTMRRCVPLAAQPGCHSDRRRFPVDERVDLPGLADLAGNNRRKDLRRCQRVFDVIFKAILGATPTMPPGHSCCALLDLILRDNQHASLALPEPPHQQCPHHDKNVGEVVRNFFGAEESGNGGHRAWPVQKDSLRRDLSFKPTSRAEIGIAAGNLLLV